MAYKETDQGIELLPESSEAAEAIKVKVPEQEAPPASAASVPAPKSVNPDVFSTEKVQVAAPVAQQPQQQQPAPAAPGTPEKTNITVPPDMANMTARQMSEFIVGAYATYFPQILYDRCKFSMPNILFHAQQGHLPPTVVDLFTRINLQTERDLQIQPMEKDFLIESVMPMVKIYKLNERPEISAVMAFTMSIGNKLKQANDVKKVNEQLLKNAIDNYLKELDKRKEKEKVEPSKN